MSELVREALRRYEKERRQETIVKYRKRAEERGLTEADVVRIIIGVRAGEGRIISSTTVFVSALNFGGIPRCSSISTSAKCSPCVHHRQSSQSLRDLRYWQE